MGDGFYWEVDDVTGAPPKELIDMDLPFAAIGYSGDTGQPGVYVSGDRFKVRKAMEVASELWPELFVKPEN